ncbi:MAG: hypothetical protein MJZ28_10505 [Paludibacteraceae bacterium]|nr:hypothetical protein [Paludibacteraceae bacterium]MCQ2218622.1 hypothetical protein [Paludibacteraceae bacterium]
MIKFLNILDLSEFDIVVLILGIILIVLSFCGVVIWNDLFRGRWKNK